MVTGGLPFTGAESSGGAGGAGGEGRSRPQLRAAIAKGFTRKQRAALACVSNECKTFVQQLLEPNVEERMKIEEAARHRWVKRAGMRMKAHPLGPLDPKVNREIYKQISELSGQTIMDVVAQIKADPFGAIGGMYNIKTHLHQMQALPGTDLLWSSNAHETRPASPPEYRTMYDTGRPDTAPTVPSSSKTPTPPNGVVQQQKIYYNTLSQKLRLQNGLKTSESIQLTQVSAATQVAKPMPVRQNAASQVTKDILNSAPRLPAQIKSQPTKELLNSAPRTLMQIKSQVSNAASKMAQITKSQHTDQGKVRLELTNSRSQPLQSPRYPIINRPVNNVYALKKPIYKVYDSGDCGLDPRLPCIEEHSNADLDTKNLKNKPTVPCVRKVSLEDGRRLNSCPNRFGDIKRSEFYRKAGDGLPSNIVSPHSSSNSHCKSERAMPVGWFARNSLAKDAAHLQRLRRTAPMK